MHKWCAWDSNPGGRFKAKTSPLSYGGTQVIDLLFPTFSFTALSEIKYHATKALVHHNQNLSNFYFCAALALLESPTHERAKLKLILEIEQFLSKINRLSFFRRSRAKNSNLFFCSQHLSLSLSLSYFQLLIASNSFQKFFKKY